MSLLLGGSLAMLRPAFAEEIPEVFDPVRPAGMGGAYTAVANDESSLWTNPAGIGRARKFRTRHNIHVFKFPNAIGGANSEGRGLYEAFNASADDSLGNVVGSADNLGDKPFWARAAAFPVTIFDLGRQAPTALGFYSINTAQAVIDKDEPTQARVRVVADSGAVLGLGWTNSSNRFNVGLSFRPTTRYAYEDRIPTDTLLDKTAMQEKLAQDANKSAGVGVDFGVMATLADFWYPTIGISALNLPTGCKENYLNPFTEQMETVCGTTYTGSFANEYALSTVDPTDIRVGVSILPRLTRSLAIRLAIDAHHLAVVQPTQTYGLSGIDVSKLLHGGIELVTGNPLEVSPFGIRGGYSQGYATFGATMNLGFISLDFASFGRDVGAGATPVEDRRYTGSVSFSF